MAAVKSKTKTIHFRVADPVWRNGRWEVVDREEDKTFVDDDRHCDWCLVCGWPSYPECRDWCEQEGYTKKS